MSHSALLAFSACYGASRSFRHLNLLQAEPTAEDGPLQIAAQTAALGAIAVSLVDVRCRGQYLSAQPNLETILEAAAIMPGYNDSDQAARRVVAAKLLAAITQRDAFVRECLITHVRLSVPCCQHHHPCDTCHYLCVHALKDLEHLDSKHDPSQHIC